MNRDEVKRLLALASGVDPMMPRPDPDVVNAWELMLADVPVEAAAHITRFYYRSERYLATRNPISPADIVQAWNARRRPTEAERAGGSVATQRQLPRAPFDPERIHAGVDRVRAALAKGRALASGVDAEEAEYVADSESAARRVLLGVRCPVETCRAAEGDPCRTGSGKPLTLAPGGVHPSRREAAFGRPETIS